MGAFQILAFILRRHCERSEAIQFTLFPDCFGLRPRNDEMRQFEMHPYIF